MRTSHLLQFVGTNRIPKRIDSGFGLFATQTRFEAANDVEPAGVASVEISEARHDCRLHHHGCKDVRSVAHHYAVEAGLSHSDNRERIAIHQNGLIQYLRGGAKA